MACRRLRRNRAASDLLFPGRHGGFMGTSALDKPFKDVVRHMQLGKSLSPRGMRRTFQDLARHAKVEGMVQRAICGHATEEMTERSAMGRFGTRSVARSTWPESPTCRGTVRAVV